MTEPRVVALLTCHNRREQTLACLRGLRSQASAAAGLDVVVLDAGSTDGTPEAIAEQFAEVILINGSEDLYWNGGMRLAFARALTEDYDHYLWVNDDTHLDDGALEVLLDTQHVLAKRGLQPAITVGSIRDPRTGELTYGGVSRPDPMRPLRFSLVAPGDEPQACETMNGNCVLVPREVVERIGNLDPAYTHGIGDYDYGLRAQQVGCGVWIAPGTVGTCPRNPAHAWRGSPRQQIRGMRSPKGLPPKEWMTFARRWGGPAWPIYAASPYVRFALRAALRT